MAGDLRLHELRQIRRRRHPADAGDGRLARRAAGPRDPRVDAVQILHGASGGRSSSPVHHHYARLLLPLCAHKWKSSTPL